MIGERLSLEFRLVNSIEVLGCFFSLQYISYIKVANPKRGRAKAAHRTAMSQTKERQELSKSNNNKKKHLRLLNVSLCTNKC